MTGSVEGVKLREMLIRYLLEKPFNVIPLEGREIYEKLV
jgi:hypothetical protein